MLAVTGSGAWAAIWQVGRLLLVHVFNLSLINLTVFSNTSCRHRVCAALGVALLSLAQYYHLFLFHIHCPVVRHKARINCVFSYPCCWCHDKIINVNESWDRQLVVTHDVGDSRSWAYTPGGSNAPTTNSCNGSAQLLACNSTLSTTSAQQDHPHQAHNP